MGEQLSHNNEHTEEGIIAAPESYKTKFAELLQNIGEKITSTKLVKPFLGAALLMGLATETGCQMQGSFSVAGGNTIVKGIGESIARRNEYVGNYLQQRDNVTYTHTTSGSLYADVDILGRTTVHSQNYDNSSTYATGRPAEEAAHEARKEAKQEARREERRNNKK